MISKLIEFSVRNRWLVITFWLAIALWGVYAMLHTPVDAIPDLSENQVIVFADWMGRSPQDIEEQITYPLSVQLQGLPHVKTVRSSSEANFSMINVIFDDWRDPWQARKDVLERLATVKMPAEVKAQLAPDATALGQIFWYTIEGEGRSLAELRTVQDFNVRYQLTSVAGVAEVASVGGFVQEYQVDVDPGKLRIYNLPLSSIYAAIAASNMSVGGKVIATPNSEYALRGIGWLTGVHDLENVVVESRGGVPIRIKDIAAVQLGPEFRRSALEKDGHEAVGGVVMMRVGENPLQVTRAIKEKIRELQPGLPEGVRIVPFYERTRLIESAIHTVTGTLTEEIIIASLAILLILAHLRSAIVVCITLPMAVLVSFLFMHYLDIPSNIMSLCGIAISIGILVDAAVVMVENATHELKLHAGDANVAGDTTEVVVRACRLVGAPIFFSVVIMLVSFLPVFALRGQEGKLSHPLAFTKTFAMVGVALMAVTLVPALIPILVRGKLHSEEQNWIVRSFINIYKPVLSWVIDRPGVVWWLMAVILVLGGALVGTGGVLASMLGVGVVFVMFGMRTRGWRWAALLSIFVIAFIVDTRFTHLGNEFRPEIDEGSLMDMPITAPRIAMAQAVDDVMVRDRIIRSFPEVEMVVGKIGRADTATDPSPIDMVETVVNMRPKAWWPKRQLPFDDMLKQAAVVADALQQHGWIKSDAAKSSGWKNVAQAVRDAKYLEQHPRLTDAAGLLNTAVQISLEHFDLTIRDLARRRQVKYESQLADELARVANDELLAHVKELPVHNGKPAFLRAVTDAELAQLIAVVQPRARLLAQVPRQEEVDKLLTQLGSEMIQRGIISNRDDLLVNTDGPIRGVWRSTGEIFGVQERDFSQQVLAAIEKRRDALWVERTRTLNWELADQAAGSINGFLIDALLKTAAHTPEAGTEPADAEIHTLRAELDKAIASSLLLWQKSKADVQRELDSELQMPGWGNVWTQPIKNRIDMLATGVRTDIGIKIFGPTGKPLNGEDGAIASVQRVAEQIKQQLDPATKGGGVDGAVDLVAEQLTGKRYLEVTIDRDKANRYGINMSQISEAIETAVGGARVTTTVEGRLRFPVRLRYRRDAWQDIDAIGDALVTGRSSAPSMLEDRVAPSSGGSSMPKETTPTPAGGMNAMSAPTSPVASGAPRPSPSNSVLMSDAAKSGGVLQIPLRMVADIRVAEGPSMIKSENGRLMTHVTLNVRGRDMLGFVDEAKAKIKPIEQTLAGTGMTVAWSGEFENQIRMLRTMAVIVPIALMLIVFLLYLTLRDILDTLLVCLAVAGAMAGTVMFQALFGFNTSTIVWIGRIAAFGMATQTGVIMMVYLREAVDRHGGLENIGSLVELRKIVIEGAVHRLRPKLLTEGVAIIGLVPMLWATGAGAEIMRPMAAPVLGGLLISDEVIDLMIPVLFFAIRRWRWNKIQAASLVANEPAAII